ncbi:MAG: hypothetical protein AVO33_02120 [delta proteobacterium ML8_F1]|nr:MAG: hypothetical protein AVO33_02120 [delta proteobacterium ML8_F1]
MKSTKVIKNFNFFVLLFITVIVLTSLGLLYIDNQRNSEELEASLLSDSMLLNQMKDQFTATISQNQSDVLFLESLYRHLDLTDDGGHLETLLKLLIEKEGIYDQMRYINAAGHEILRINYTDSRGVIVGAEQLQDKSTRYYFNDTLHLPQGGIYISALDLNMENSRLEIPYKPMIRFATPLIHPEEGLEGIAITNYLAGNLLDQLNRIAQRATDHLVLLNSNGYFLTHREPLKTFGFMIEDRSEHTFMIRYPDVWQQIISGETLIESSEGIFQILRIDLADSLPGEVYFGGNETIYYAVAHIENNETFSHLLDRWTPTQLLRVMVSNLPLLFLVILSALLTNILLALYRDKQNRIEHFATYDPLTETYNRRAGMKIMENLLEFRASTRIPLSLCFIDLDNLKTVNDQLGHSMGDRLIVALAAILKSETRLKDVICRYGGDEFIILFDETDASAADNIWSRIKSRMEAVNQSSENRFQIQVSHGIVTYHPDRHDSLEELIEEADEKMYAEKTAKKEIRE